MVLRVRELSNEGFACSDKRIGLGELDELGEAGKMQNDTAAGDRIRINASPGDAPFERGDKAALLLIAHSDQHP